MRLIRLKFPAGCSDFLNIDKLVSRLGRAFGTRLLLPSASRSYERRTARLRNSPLQRRYGTRIAKVLRRAGQRCPPSEFSR